MTLNKNQFTLKTYQKVVKQKTLMKMNHENGIHKCSKNLLLRLVVNGSIITKLSLRVFMAAYENIDW